MVHWHFWRTGVRLAWRDLRKSNIQGALIALPMALSIASMVGVRGAADIARQALQGGARATLAADLCVDTRQPINQEQVEVLNRMRQDSIEWTLMATALTMAASAQAADPGFVAVKAIDPSVYPFYGAVALSPRQTLVEALRSDSVVVSEDVLERFQIRVGDPLLIAGQRFRIAARINAEPDRLSGELGFGMRCMLSREGYQRTRIDRLGNSVKQRVLVRLGRQSDLLVTRRRLQDLFPEGNIRDYRAARNRQTALSETAISFMSVTAFLSLVLGAIGVALAVRQHADQRMPALAIMKILGGRGPQLATLFLFQIGCMFAAALAAGLPLGFLLRRSILSLAGRYVDLPPLATWSFRAVLESAAATAMVVAPVLIGPAFLIRNLRPLPLLRRDTGEPGATVAGWYHRIAPLSAAVSFAGLTALAYRMLRSWTSASLVVAALMLSAGGAWVLTAAALRLLRRCTSAAGMRNWPVARYAIASLYRPGNHTRTLIVALAAALTVVIATYDGSAAIVRAAFQILPYDQNSLYLAGFQATDLSGARQFLQSLPGVVDVKMMSQTRLSLETVRAPLHETFPARAKPAGPARNRAPHAGSLRRDGTCNAGDVLDAADSGDACTPLANTEAIPSGTHLRSDLLQAARGRNALTADQWNESYARVTGIPQRARLWPPANRAQAMTVDYYLEQRANAGLSGWSFLVTCGAEPARLAIADDVARSLHLAIGASLEFESRDRAIEAVVTSIRKFGPVERFWSGMELDCGAMDPASLFHYAAVQVTPDRMTAIRMAIRDQYPTLPVITSHDIAEMLAVLSSDALALVRAVAWYAIAAGLCILVAAVAASRQARSSEIGILSALGARRATLLKMYTLEFAAIGVLSSAIAGLLACGFASVVMSVIFQRLEIVLEWKPIAAAVAGAALLTVVAGWLPVYGLLRRKPMEVLRDE